MRITRVIIRSPVIRGKGGEYDGFVAQEFPGFPVEPDEAHPWLI